MISAVAGATNQQIDALRNGDMFDSAFEIGFAAGGIAEHIGDDFLPAQRRKRQRCDELARLAVITTCTLESVFLQKRAPVPRPYRRPLLRSHQA